MVSWLQKQGNLIVQRLVFTKTTYKRNKVTRLVFFSDCWTGCSLDLIVSQFTRLRSLNALLIGHLEKHQHFCGYLPYDTKQVVNAGLLFILQQCAHCEAEHKAISTRTRHAQWCDSFAMPKAERIWAMPLQHALAQTKVFLLWLHHSYTKIPSGPAELVYEYCSRVAAVKSANTAFLYLFISATFLRNHQRCITRQRWSYRIDNRLFE